MHWHFSHAAALGALVAMLGGGHPPARAACPVIAAGADHSLAVRPDGSAWAWGWNADGQLGDGSTTSSLLPQPVRDASGTGVLTALRAIAGGAQSSLALGDDGSVWAWGANHVGQLGDGTYNSSLLPVRVRDSTGLGFLAGVSTIAAGPSHVLALGDDGSLWAWGANARGELGNGSACLPWPCGSNLPNRVRDPGGTGPFIGAVAIAAGDSLSLALRDDGTVWAWGANFNGELGNGTTDPSYLPVQVRDASGTGHLASVTAIDAGQDVAGTHVLALAADATIWAWGRNGYGELGSGAACNPRPCGSALPVEVRDPSGTGAFRGAAAVAAGGTHSLALRGDGSVWAWGDGGTGQLGIGLPPPTPSPSPSPSPSPTPGPSPVLAVVPVQVKDEPGTGFLSGVVAIAAGIYHSLALAADGAVWTWGNNNDGQLGNGTRDVSGLPARAAIDLSPGLPPDQGNVLLAVRDRDDVVLAWTGSGASIWSVSRDPFRDQLGLTPIPPSLTAPGFVDPGRVRIPGLDHYRVKGLSACGPGP